MQASSGEWVEPPVGAHALVEEADMRRGGGTKR
jgi:hypothetical protein